MVNFEHVQGGDFPGKAEPGLWTGQPSGAMVQISGYMGTLGMTVHPLARLALLMRFLPIFLLLLVTSCGGGGGGGAGTGEPLGKISLVLSSTSEFVTADLFDANPTINVTARLDNWRRQTPVYTGAVYEGDAIANAIITLTETRAEIAIEMMLPADLGAGLYTGKVRVMACKDTACNEHYAGSPANINISYRVDDGLAVQNKTISYSHRLGQPLPTTTETLWVKTGGSDWSASAAESWVVLDSASGSGEGEVGVGFDSSGMAPGIHFSDLTFSSSDNQVSDVYRTVRLEVLAPALYVTPYMAELDTHVDTELPQYADIAYALYGDLSLPWSTSLVSDQGSDWLVIEPSSGTINNTEQTFRVSPAASAPAGSYEGTVFFEVDVNGKRLKYGEHVSLILQEHILTVEDKGVAFTAFPASSRLTQSVTVGDSRGQDTGWTATDNASWLTVTPNGRAGEDVVLTADVSGLATDQFYTAAVTVASDDISGDAGVEVIEVGLWVGSSDPAPSAVVSSGFEEILADPVRPYVYARSNTDIEVYNVHTAALVDTLSSIGSDLAAMAVRTDGSILYALDRATDKIVPVDLATRTAGTPFQYSTAYFSPGGSEPFSMAYLHNNDRDLLLVARNGIVHAVDLAHNSLAGEGELGLNKNRIMASADGSRLCGTEPGGMQPDMESAACIPVWFDVAQGKLLALGGRVGAGEGISDIAISGDGDHLLVADQWLGSFAVYSVTSDGFGTEILLAADASPIAVAMDDDGRLATGVYLPTNAAGEMDLRIHGSDGAEASSAYVSAEGENILARGLEFSGDGLRTIIRTSDSKLLFIEAR